MFERFYALRFPALLLLAMSAFSCSKGGGVEWKKLEGMNKPRAAFAMVVSGGEVYALGGSDKDGYTASCERAGIKPDGTLAEWKKTFSLNVPRGYAAAVIHNGYVYVLGGANGEHGSNLLNTVERAGINPDGSIGRWVIEKEKLFSARRGVTIAAHDGYIYAIGGYNGEFLDTIETAKINPDGTLGQWDIVSIMLERRYIHSSVVSGGLLYVAGGHQRSTGGALNKTEYAPLLKDGNIGEWKEGTALNIARYGAGAAASDGLFMFVGGGYDGGEIDTVETARINKDGTIEKWKTVARLSTPRNDLRMFARKGFLYVMGGANKGGYFNTVEAAAIDDEGGIIAWREK